MVEDKLQQPWKQLMADEIAARKEAELDPSKKAEQEKLRSAHESKEGNRYACEQAPTKDGFQINQLASAAG